MADPENLRHEEWVEGGKALPGFFGFVALGAAFAYHLITFQWLRAPRWKNPEEARAELSRLVADHQAHDYAFWAGRNDETKRVEFTTKAGTWYQATIRPFWDDQPHGAIRVLFGIDDGGIGAYHPLTDSLLLQNPRAAGSGPSG